MQLSSCSVALRGGRCTWRHDKVLSSLSDMLEQRRPEIVNFIRAGESDGGVEGSELVGSVSDSHYRS